MRCQALGAFDSEIGGLGRVLKPAGARVPSTSILAERADSTLPRLLPLRSVLWCAFSTIFPTGCSSRTSSETKGVRSTEGRLGCQALKSRAGTPGLHSSQSWTSVVAARLLNLVATDLQTTVRRTALPKADAAPWSRGAAGNGSNPGRGVEEVLDETLRQKLAAELGAALAKLSSEECEAVLHLLHGDSGPQQHQQQLLSAPPPPAAQSQQQQQQLQQRRQESATAAVAGACGGPAAAGEAADALPASVQPAAHQLVPQVGGRACARMLLGNTRLAAASVL